MQNVTTDRQCERCNRIMHVRLVRNITASGVSQVYWYCTIGKHAIKKNGGFISHEKIRSAGYDPDDLPVINNYSGTNLCAVCQSPYAEYHHFAPRHLFGNECDKWPTGYLCKKHHDEWHKKVTPNMAKAKQWTLIK